MTSTSADQQRPPGVGGTNDDTAPRPSASSPSRSRSRSRSRASSNNSSRPTAASTPEGASADNHNTSADLEGEEEDPDRTLVAALARVSMVQPDNQNRHAADDRGNDDGGITPPPPTSYVDNAVDNAAIFSLTTAESTSSHNDATAAAETRHGEDEDDGAPLIGTNVTERPSDQGSGRFSSGKRPAVDATQLALAESLESLTARVSDERRLEECPFCMECQSNIHKRDKTSCFDYVCCGKWSCCKCHKKWGEKEGSKAKQCPLCRTPLPITDQEAFAQLLKAAKKGKPWAQDLVGKCYKNGEGVPANPAEALMWWGKAAGQGWCEASTKLGIMYFYGDGVEKSLEEARRYLVIAAASKEAEPLLLLSGCCTSPSERVQFLRLAAEQGLPEAQYRLGDAYNLYYEEEGADRSVKDGLYWYLKAADQGHVKGPAAVFKILTETHGTRAFPKALYWTRKASACSDMKVANAATEVQNQVETFIKNRCAKCYKKCTDNVPLLKCGRCKGIYYCGRECQKAHHKEGHKEDCLPKDIDELTADERQNHFITYCFP